MNKIIVHADRILSAGSVRRSMVSMAITPEAAAVSMDGHDNIDAGYCLDRDIVSPAGSSIKVETRFTTITLSSQTPL